jgi:putative sigma-54 modulation protein
MNENNIIIMSSNMNVGEGLKATAREKVKHLFRHHGQIMRVQLELSHESYKSHDEEYLAKGHVTIEGAPMIVSVSSGNILSSIDQVVDKLDRKLRRRSRLNKVKRKDVHSIDIPADLPKVAVLTANE